ncbi:hypothetical protein DYB32_005127 [Aphanomyces invadans]|uniref:Uncharacterized protein n=1 Tax=Aphanomyces invadans TaxID=157072 RepID=A0A3R7A8Q6_9STRA|nr:hypothetical protein DYB32_005127 [Aphanomyces invadans]
MSVVHENNDHVEITMVHIPPGARTSESEGPDNKLGPIPTATTDKKLMLEPQHHDELYQSEEKDYVDPTLFSAEVSRHSIEIAVRRARNLEQELRDIEKNAPPPLPPPTVSYTSVIATTISSTVQSVMKRITSSASTTQYSLLEPNASSSEGSSGIVGERDIVEGDGMQLSPVGNGRDNDDIYLQHRSGLRPALRKISAYEKPISSAMLSSVRTPKKSIAWTQLPHEVSDEANDIAMEGQSLMNPDQIKITITSSQHERPKRQQKPGVIRRLTPVEKEALYVLRPDLKIVPNWAQKYREEMTGTHDTMQCNNWLMCLILFLMVLLVFLFYMIGVTKPDGS